MTLVFAVLFHYNSLETRADVLPAEVLKCGQPNLYGEDVSAELLDCSAWQTWVTQDGRAAAAALQHECLAAGDQCTMLLNDGVRTLNSSGRDSDRHITGVTTVSGQRQTPSSL